MRRRKSVPTDIAREAAFGENVEFLVELVGKKSVVGIDSFRKKADLGLSFTNFLLVYTPGTDAVAPEGAQHEAVRLEDFGAEATKYLELSKAVNTRRAYRPK